MPTGEIAQMGADDEPVLFGAIEKPPSRPRHEFRIVIEGRADIGIRRLRLGHVRVTNT
jgi:hypothetical protein